MIAMQPPDDRRRTPRVKIGNLVAYIDLRDGSAMQTVCVWDLSLGGACLLVKPDVRLTQEFDLVIDGLAHPVKQIWHRSCHVGVQLCLASPQKSAA